MSYKIYIGEDETFDKTVRNLARGTIAGGVDLGAAFLQMTLS